MCFAPGLQYFDAHVMMNTFALNDVFTRAAGCCEIKRESQKGRKPKTARRKTSVKERNKGLIFTYVAMIYASAPAIFSDNKQLLEWIYEQV